MNSLAVTVKEACIKALTVNHVKNPNHNKTVKYIVSMTCLANQVV